MSPVIYFSCFFLDWNYIFGDIFFTCLSFPFASIKSFQSGRKTVPTFLLKRQKRSIFCLFSFFQVRIWSQISREICFCLKRPPKVRSVHIIFKKKWDFSSIYTRNKKKKKMTSILQKSCSIGKNCKLQKKVHLIEMFSCMQIADFSSWRIICCNSMSNFFSNQTLQLV